MGLKKQSKFARIHIDPNGYDQVELLLRENQLQAEDVTHANMCPNLPTWHRLGSASELRQSASAIPNLSVADLSHNCKELNLKLIISTSSELDSLYFTAVTL